MMIAHAEDDVQIAVTVEIRQRGIEDVREYPEKPSLVALSER